MSKQCTVHFIRDQASTEENYEKKYSKERERTMLGGFTLRIVGKRKSIIYTYIGVEVEGYVHGMDVPATEAWNTIWFESQQDFIPLLFLRSLDRLYLEQFVAILLFKFSLIAWLSFFIPFSFFPFYFLIRIFLPVYPIYIDTFELKLFIEQRRSVSIRFCTVLPLSCCIVVCRMSKRRLDSITAFHFEVM